MATISYQAPRYPFTLTRHNAIGPVESETMFEGHATYFEDKDTQYCEWEVEAWVTGFTQYKNGKVISKVTGIKSKDWTVENLEAFEADCVEAAISQFKYKKAA